MGLTSSGHYGEDAGNYSQEPKLADLQRCRDSSRMRDEERYPIPVEDAADQQRTPVEHAPEPSLPQVAMPQYSNHHYGGGQDLYIVENGMNGTKSPCEGDSLELTVPIRDATRRKLIFGLRRRVFFSLAGTILILVIVGAVIGALVGSSRIGDNRGSSSDSGPLLPNQRQIGAATMDITGSTRANIQVAYQDLETTDLLYRLIWDDAAGAEQRLSNLSPEPRRGTPIAVTTVNATNGIEIEVFYLSVNADNSSMSNICQLTLECGLGATNCSVSQNKIISDVTNKGVFETSGLAVTTLSDTSETQLYYKGGGRAIRVLSRTNDPSSTGWVDGFVGSSSFAGSAIGVNFNSNEDTIQVVWVSAKTKELQEMSYSDSTGANGIAATAVATSDPQGWSAGAQFTTCFQRGLDQHHIFYVASTGNIWGLWRRDSNSTWSTARNLIEWGSAVGGIASVAWDNEVRLLYMAGTPPTLAMSASNGSDWSSAQSL